MGGGGVGQFRSWGPRSGSAKENQNADSTGRQGPYRTLGPLDVVHAPSLLGRDAIGSIQQVSYVDSIGRPAVM
jgi:hypothetical protein